MNNTENVTELPVNDEPVSKFAALKARVSQLPLKKIAIAAAVTTAAAIVIANKDKFGSDESIEIGDVETLDDGTQTFSITAVND